MARALAFINPRLTTGNAGDLFIEDSVKRILEFDPARSVDVDPRTPVTSDDLARINACDAAVIVGTNLWYRHLHKPGRWMFTAQDLERIRVPIIPFGVGTTRHRGDDNGFDEDTLEQLRRIHASCAAGSARDPRTAEALEEAGIPNVAMTGCPTLYRSLKARWSRAQRPPTRRVVVTPRKGQRANIRRLLHGLRDRGWDPVIAAQVPKDLDLRRGLPWRRIDAPIVHALDLEPYLRLVEEAHGAIGWRLHGNMLHLAHGNPAVFFANCSRAASFCSAFGLPYDEVEDGESLGEAALAAAIDRLEDPAYPSALPAAYARHRATMVRFLEANGLDHRLEVEAATPVAVPGG